MCNYLEILDSHFHGNDKQRKNPTFCETISFGLKLIDMMNSIFIIAGAALLYIIAYNTYGRFLGKKVFKLKHNALCPSEEFQDNLDFVPTQKPILFESLLYFNCGNRPDNRLGTCAFVDYYRFNLHAAQACYGA